MPHGYQRFDNSIRELLTSLFPNPNTAILDVGAGAGRYRDILSEYKNLDAVEVYAPYIEEFNLRKKYRQVFLTDILQFRHFKGYELVIFGDVLEHIATPDAQALIARILEAGCNIIVGVPYLMEQEPLAPYLDNEHERHLQPDLTHEVVKERYPQFERKFFEDGYGVYVAGPRFSSRLAPSEGPDLDRLRTYHVCIGTPTYGQSLTTGYFTSALRTQEYFVKLGIKINFFVFDGAAVDKARNLIVGSFLNTAGATHLLFMDADQMWRPSDILRLLNMNRDIIGIAVRRKKLAVEYNVNFLGTEAEIQEGAIEVRDLGTGCMLIKRRVFEKLIHSYPELKIDSLDEQVKAPENSYCFFQFTIKDGKYYGEDYSFCQRWRAIGGTIWIDPKGLIGHTGIYTYQGAIEDTFQEAPQNVSENSRAG